MVERMISAVMPYGYGALMALVIGFQSVNLLESTCWRCIA
jgi:hypothetical protein